MPIPLLSVVAAIAALGVLAFLVYRCARAFLAFRGTRVVVCPETHQAAAVTLDARRAATSASLGQAHLRLDACSRWPERQGCGQECLDQIASAPESCLLRRILADWYADRSCVLCQRPFGALHWHDHRPALLSPEGAVVEWAHFPAERVSDVLATHRPLCWSCGVSEAFRRDHPQLVTDRPPR